jgi:DNA uptake protein ComE-like DNA-binding protein
MGFSEKQAAAIVKYKNYLGGSFVSKEKFKECFIISDENYSKLHSYLILPEKTPENFEENKRKFVSEKTKINYFEFNPNELNAIGWQKLGFSEKQANVIVNYRDKNLKGSFKSLEDIEKCFVISAEKFNEMKPYIKLIIPQNNIQNTSSNSTKTAISKTDFSKTDLNKITFAQLIEFGFDEKAAASYIGFRNKLGGFVNKNQILETYNIDKNIAEKLITISPLTNDNIHKYNLLNVSEEWLKNHPILNTTPIKFYF